MTSPPHLLQDPLGGSRAAEAAPAVVPAPGRACSVRDSRTQKTVIASAQNTPALEAMSQPVVSWELRSPAPNSRPIVFGE